MRGLSDYFYTFSRGNWECLDSFWSLSEVGDWDGVVGECSIEEGDMESK